MFKKTQSSTIIKKEKGQSQDKDMEMRRRSHGYLERRRKRTRNEKTYCWGTYSVVRKKEREKWEEEAAYKEDSRDKQLTQTEENKQGRKERLSTADGKQTHKAFQLRKDTQEDWEEAYYSD
jgi:hypothetical protein